MKILKSIIYLIVLVAILYGGWRAMGYMQQRQAAETETRETASGEEQVKQVEVWSVETGSLKKGIWMTGEVNALQCVEIASKISGRLEKLRLPDGTVIEEGVEVKEGQTIAVIEHKQLSAAVRLSEAALDVAKANLDTSKVNLDDALREKNRYSELFKSGAGTEQQQDQAVAAYERALSQFKQSQASVTQAEAALEQAKVNLDEATIEAPFSGIVVMKYVDEGSFVTPSKSLFMLADISKVEITGGVSENYYPELQVGKSEAVIEVDAYPSEPFDGVVSRVRPQFDRITRTVAVTICVPNPQKKLMPGMFARVELILDNRENIIVVPDEALVSHDGKMHAYVVNHSKVQIRDVVLGLEEGDMNEVLNGLQAGERIILRGHELLSDGMTVDVVKEGNFQ